MLTVYGQKISAVVVRKRSGEAGANHALEKVERLWTLQRKARPGATLLLTMDAFFERLEGVIGAPVDQIKVGVR